MTNEQDAAAQPEHVIPPEPVVPPAPATGLPTGMPPGVPLAPPLSAPPAPPPHAAWPPSSPPYAAGPAQQGYPQQGYPQPAGYPQPTPYSAAAYPLSSEVPPPARSISRTAAVVLSVVGGLVVLSIVAIASLLGIVMNSSAPPPPPAAATEQPSDGSGTGTAPDAAAGEEIADILEAKIDEYKRLRDSGALWQSIPDTDFNRTAVSAFLYLLTDMKVATIWGIDAAQAQEYEERMTMLEERLLAQEPLGEDIRITLEDEVFRYDGETGEGGYTAE
ncbi:hypothetical protein [Microbacterium sp. 3J1]|uniref:hypothetical protein n=1 Tax=Microbacterium sp. 3J1 TaxID=861269 RepID=UPI000A418764|nr:hypothetical protein [Microbacterium sp. 3J1]